MSEQEQFVAKGAGRASGMNLALASFAGKIVGDIHKKNDDQKQSGGYLSVSNYCSKVCHFERCLSISTEMSKKIIAKPIFFINNKIALPVSKFVKLGVINATPNHIPEILIERAESAFSQYLGIVSINDSLNMGQISVNQNLEGSAG